MADYRYFAVPILNTHRREQQLQLVVERAQGVKVALGMEITYAPRPIYPPPSKFVARVLKCIESEQLDNRLRARLLAVAEDEEARLPYLVASGFCGHSVNGEIPRQTAERLASDGRSPAELDKVLADPGKLEIVPMRFRDVRQLLFQVDGSTDPANVTVEVRTKSGVTIAKFPLRAPVEQVSKSLPNKP